MTAEIQGLLFADPETASGEAHFRRTPLSRGAWVDVAPGWAADPDRVFARLVDGVDWRAERRVMYDRTVAVPRLTRYYRADEHWPDPALREWCERLSQHYAEELGEPFTTAGCCYYRDGRDSVAWHGDTFGRGASHDTMVAIVSLGDQRRLSLRPRGGGRSLSFAMGHGDLVVMGGTCQRTWKHAVLKTAQHVGPRISVQFRPAGVA